MDDEIPHFLRNHTLAGDFVITGISPQELFGFMQFNVEDLVKEFTIICPDFQNKLLWVEEKPVVLEFVMKVLFDLGPEIRRVLRSNSNKRWSFEFFTKPEEGRKLSGTVIICTSASPRQQPKTKNGSLVLSPNHAFLLANYKLVDIIEPALADGVILMTPIAMACFKKDDLNNICIDCHIEPTDENKAKLLASINQSCERNGQYLPYSECHIAVVFAIATSKHLNPNRLYENVRKTVRAYSRTCKKVFDKAKYEVFCKYSVQGGVERDLAPEKVLELLNKN